MASISFLDALKKVMSANKDYSDSHGVQSVNGLTGDATVCTPNDIPMVFLTGDTTDMTKDNAVVMAIEYFSPTVNFSGYVNIKWQGSSSINFPKKNYTIKIYKDEACEEKLKVDVGWGKQNKYCLKANYIDHTHARNIVNANLWSEMVASRSDYADYPSQFKDSPNNCAVDGFPVKVYINGVYNGLGTMNIPKDDWMFAADDATVVLCGNANNNGDNTKELSTEFRTTIVDSYVNGWDEEVGTLSADYKAHLNQLITLVMTATDADFKANLATYANISSLIDYYIFMYVINDIDGLAKNMLMMRFTADGKWFAGAYDLDSTWGSYFDGKITYTAQNPMQSGYVETNSLLWQRIEKCFRTEIKERYAELRNTVLSVANVFRKFEAFNNKIPYGLYAEDLTVYSGIPADATLQQIRAYASARLAYVDSCIESLGKTITSISAVYSGGAVESDTDVNDLKSDLAITGMQEDGEAVTLTDYTLSGTIADGENTITVAYGELTTTFTVVGQTTKTVTGITAVSNANSYEEGTAASDLDLTVTASMSDGSTKNVSGWTADGTVALGENTFTVTYQNFTTTVTVTGVSSSTVSGGILPDENGVYDILSGTGIYDKSLNADGSVSNYNGSYITDYINVSMYDTITISVADGTSKMLNVSGSGLCYDADQALVGTIKSVFGLKDNAVPAGSSVVLSNDGTTKFIRLSGVKADILNYVTMTGSNA